MCRLDTAVLPGVDASEGPTRTDVTVGTEQQVLVKVKPIESRKELPRSTACDRTVLTPSTPRCSFASLSRSTHRREQATEPILAVFEHR
jgi:hypothetical protein